MRKRTVTVWMIMVRAPRRDRGTATVHWTPSGLLSSKAEAERKANDLNRAWTESGADDPAVWFIAPIEVV